MKILSVICIALLVSVASVFAQPADSTRVDSLPPMPDTSSLSVDTSPYQIRIQQLLVTDMRLNDTLDVTFNSHGRPVGGFDLKIAIDDPAIDILEILPGRMYDSCRWEYFSARRLETPPREGIPRQIWQVVALSQVIPDSIQPLCFAADSDISVLRMIVSNEHQAATDDRTIPIFFFWEDCSDNSISDRSGNQLFISRRVHDYTGRLPDSSAPLFPSRFGAPLQCVNPAVRFPMKRLIDFHNGAIEFRLDIAPAGTASPGDSL